MAGSGGASFQTELATMQAASRHVYDVNEQIQTQLSRLMAQLDPLTSSWKGSAASSFEALKERWFEDANRLNQALRGIGDGLASTHATYQRAEASSQSGFDGVGSGLG